jgi:hypothetical protein
MYTCAKLVAQVDIGWIIQCARVLTREPAARRRAHKLIGGSFFLFNRNRLRSAKHDRKMFSHQVSNAGIRVAGKCA